MPVPEDSHLLKSSSVAPVVNGRKASVGFLRTSSPDWEEDPELLLVKEGALADGKDEYTADLFKFKHSRRLSNPTTEKRASQRKMANLEKFLTSVKKSARLSQYDAQGFHSLSTAKKYTGFIDNSSLQDLSVGYFEKEFDIIERIGFGDFAEVFKVRWKRNNEIYALKRSINRYASCFGNEDPEHDQLRWMNEMFIHCAISDHPNVVECVQCWEESGYFHIQMEYLPERLDTYAAAHYPLSQTALWNIFTDLLLALDHIHSKQFCHLDVKPENIFLDHHGVTKLGDFSLITIPDSDHKDGGDARYMPLEALESRNLGFSCDVFSLGMTMLELCTDIQLDGHGPQWRKLREGNLPSQIEERIPASMKQIIRQMLSRSPKLRPRPRSLLRCDAVKYHVFTRKLHHMSLPLLKLQDCAMSVVSSVFTFGRKWVSGIFWPKRTPERPTTPPPTIGFAEHALRHNFTAGVAKVSARSPSVDIQPETLSFHYPEDGFSRNGMNGTGNLNTSMVVEPETSFADADDSLLSMSFMETLQDEMGDHLREESLICSGLVNETGNFSPSMSTRSNLGSPSKKFQFVEPESNELNHVCVLEDGVEDENDL
ncbi:hypothetical protein RvY_07851 [Ramazzottius varieornatus]|uniref:non-specific serine/threonine protein kinase n=1 Tax=Ramazzottius varieornatus TaxID=947166 RepID=A0A1D1V3P8_RAMVA|nr:hypothetical protein RvY_07851 [Ramazzottius varieornatus]